jgi:hypothetical protein
MFPPEGLGEFGRNCGLDTSDTKHVSFVTICDYSHTPDTVLNPLATQLGDGTE